MTYEEILEKNVDAFTEHVWGAYDVDSMNDDKKTFVKNLMSTTIEAYTKGFENGYDFGYLKGIDDERGKGNMQA